MVIAHVDASIVLGSGLLVVAAAMLAGCNDDSSSGTSPCTPGESQACAGPGACAGHRVCSADGLSFGTCDCGAGGGGGEGSATGGAAGSGAVDPGPLQRGASYLSPTSGGCNVSGGFAIPDGSAPTTDTFLGDRVEDGIASATVQCTVAASGSGFSVDANVTQGNRGLQVIGTVAPSATSPGGYEGSGTVLHYDAQTGPLQTLPGATCTITVDVTQDIAAGHVWGNWVCPADTFGDPTAPGVVCSAEGHFVFENCAQ